MNDYVVSRNPIDGKYRVTLREDAPYGVCYGGAHDTIEAACVCASTFLGIDPLDIEVW